MDLQLRGRSVVIAGGSAGIGRATALALAEQGSSLALGARDEETLKTVSDAAQDRGAEVLSLAGDLTTDEGTTALAAAAVERYGAIHGLVCCVGATPLGLFHEVDDATWMTAIEMKLLATIRMIRAVLPSMREQGSGRIVIVAGNAAHETVPHMLTSGVVNAGLGALASTLARTYAPEGITINAVNPGPTRTRRYDGLIEAVRNRYDLPDAAAAEAAILSQIPAGRPASPEQIADLIAFLLSPRSGHINGAPLVIDGGQTWAR